MVPDADSATILGRSRDAQRRFERLRVRHLPIGLSSGSSPCDERVGRMCYWHGDNDYEPDPEAVEITLAREELLDTLAHAARQLPGDSWIAGQRVHYLIEAGRAHEALAAARSCMAPEPGWCAAVRGLALHRLERFEDAERAFRAGLEAMDSRSAEEWLSPEPLLGRSDGSHLDRLEPEARVAASRLLWSLADPYYLVRGNDRWTEHMSRHTGGRILSRASNPHGMPWTAGLDELAIRYGHEVSWTRSVPTVGPSMRPLVTGRHPPHSERYLPPDGVLSGSRPLGERAWGAAVERPRSAYAPSYAPELATLHTVLSWFRRADSLLVVAPFRFERLDGAGAAASGPPADALDGPSGSVQAGLFLLPWSDTAATSRPVTTRVLAESGTLWMTVPLGSYVYSVEALDRTAGQGARVRGGISLAPHPGDIPDLSDLVIVDASSPSYESLDDVIGHILPSMKVGVLQELAVAWEAYGTASGEAEVAYRLVIERLDRSLLSRLGEFLRLSQGDNPLNLEWSEPTPDHPGAHFRSVDLDLGNLEAGSYELRLQLRVGEWAPVIRRRRLEIIG